MFCPARRVDRTWRRVRWPRIPRRQEQRDREIMVEFMSSSKPIASISKPIASASISKPIASISVVMPAYNEQDVLPISLREAVDALEEMATDWEIVIVDDGSTDATPRILAEWS